MTVLQSYFYNQYLEYSLTLSRLASGVLSKYFELTIPLAGAIGGIVDPSVHRSVELTLVHCLSIRPVVTNMVASDLIAGLVLLRWQTHQWVGCGHRVPMSCILRDTEPYNPTPEAPSQVTYAAITVGLLDEGVSGVPVKTRLLLNAHKYRS
ncbi:unnamed protein product [Schistocephalus solidus]|uniref:Anaphase-promoting complex subunit 1 n=1 Tax=Schistocephalus solidus TaxID=70667 RepID=A0A183TML9_SCHSO|nr:unnamed protein product [Schistocephalus solidus]